MTPNNLIGAPKKGLSKLVRAKFGPGMLLQHDDLEQLNVYTRSLNRLMFRSLFGCGVICGLVVSVELKCGKLCVTVAEGLALDCCGDPVHVPQAQHILVSDNCDPNVPSPLWVVLCGTEKSCAPRTSMCAPDDDESSCLSTREHDGFEIRVLTERPECVCGCPEASAHGLLDSSCKCVNPELECYVDHYAGKCTCGCAECSDCECDCILLARLVNTGDAEHPVWAAEHHVRRFIRPVLMRDPQVEREQAAILAHQVEQQAQAEVGAPTQGPRGTRRRSRRQDRSQATPGQDVDPGPEDARDAGV